MGKNRSFFFAGKQTALPVPMTNINILKFEIFCKINEIINCYLQRKTSSLKKINKDLKKIVVLVYKNFIELYYYFIHIYISHIHELNFFII